MKFTVAFQFRVSVCSGVGFGLRSRLGLFFRLGLNLVLDLGLGECYVQGQRQSCCWIYGYVCVRS